MHIKPTYKNTIINEDVYNYNSKTNPLTKEELYNYLIDLRLLNAN
jgi:hypothetical protein